MLEKKGKQTAAEGRQGAAEGGRTSPWPIVVAKFIQVVLLSALSSRRRTTNVYQTWLERVVLRIAQFQVYLISRACVQQGARRGLKAVAVLISAVAPYIALKLSGYRIAHGGPQ